MNQNEVIAKCVREMYEFEKRVARDKLRYEMQSRQIQFATDQLIAILTAPWLALAAEIRAMDKP